MAEANPNCCKRGFESLVTVKNSTWFKKCLALLSVILYCFDVGSDIYVGITLLSLCHNFYGITVLSIVLIPGFIFGCYLWFKKIRIDQQKRTFVLLAPFFPLFGTIFLIPFTLYCLVNAALKIGSTKEEETEKNAIQAKKFQVLFQSFPQVIIGVFIMQCLQMSEAGIIISFFLSLTSLMYGGGCLPALLYHEQEVEGLKVFWALFINSIDTVLRCLFMAYMMSIFKEYAGIVILLTYFIGVALSICIERKSWSFTDSGSDFLTTMHSFPCSAYKIGNVNIRSKSKIVFGIIFVISMTFVCISTNTEILKNSGYALEQFENDTNICEVEDSTLGYCNDRWKHLSQNIHLRIQIVLWSLLVLSSLDMVIRRN